MFSFDKDLTIHVTRGDILYFSVSAEDKVQNERYTFQPGDIVRMSIYEKNNCANVFTQKDFLVSSPTEEVEIFLGSADTKIGDVIDKPTAYWYEVVLNPGINEQTIIGNDTNGAKVIMLYPEGGNITKEDIEEPEEDIGEVDSELDPFSERAVKNSVVARAVLALNSALNVIKARMTSFTSLKEGSTTGDAELQDIRAGADGTVYENAGEAVRRQVKDLSGRIQILENEKKYVFTDEEKYKIAESVAAFIDASLLELLGTGDV